ncbi:hypothetical protein COCSUDRAFT_61063 [Coccomyxa subellipsoidea C-169]|uniref:Uncharacterized protein n=1 Tax=Coccomyxa subellipsoidea (strain C-169) TaxID=574566 RepID=I0Z5Z8_COCSC|nr:hypothetical protein COCSUDRAFT_61063 [Coccomyxa subellipsoidea C-169]EIE26067.1 hypothetical protein COCSUDRAFT_61063 [Coccomyxa subellipsoidea C-169]|eukprot:XP_005650611.1 hypothetical protein COCSUDRAFT_61063 [Coccomyxa subellipsoidea C-169]
MVSPRSRLSCKLALGFGRLASEGDFLALSRWEDSAGVRDGHSHGEAGVSLPSRDLWFAGAGEGEDQVWATQE